MNPSKGVQIQPAYILSARPFRETSLLLEVFSRDCGRVSLVARGARGHRGATARKKSPRFSVSLQPFSPLLLSWSGRGNLFNLIHAEPNGMPPQVEGALLKGGWYMNELLVRTLGHWDAHTELFMDYQAALYGLAENFHLHLRQFEKSLLIALGVLPQLDYARDTGEKIQRESWYLFSPFNGITCAEGALNVTNCFQGAVLLAVQEGNWEDKTYWPFMKRLFRLMLDEVLSHQPIRSRDLL